MRMRMLPLVACLVLSAALCTAFVKWLSPFASAPVDAIDSRHGYSTGAACHAMPSEPQDSRPHGCQRGLLQDERAAVAAALRASVIMISHNEAGCAVRRTLLTVAARTPSLLLEELIVLDDSSSPAAEQAVTLAGGLPVTTTAHVRWIRSEHRLGVARSRMHAASAARGAALVFLDAHCEPQHGWLPPLLALLARSPHVVALPVIEVLDKISWRYRPGPRPAHPPRGVLAGWRMLEFGWSALTPSQRVAVDAAGPLSPQRTPAMAGGLFAIRRDWFESSGAYDPGLEVWGGENAEMSLRMWACGGALYTLPCARVGHMFRSQAPFSWPNGSGALTVKRNAWRVAAVWMDEAAANASGLGLTATALRALRGAPGLNERRELRRRLNCRSFRWYLRVVHPDHPPLPPDSQ